MVWLFGIDTAAHIGSIATVGNTIAVLGGGFNNIFPEENLELFKDIINYGGLVLTEYEPDTEAQGKNFPVRNRIISGLSLRSTCCRSGI